MGFFSHKVEKRYLKPGDHIYTWRAGFVYAHHGIYKGGEGDPVVHFTSATSASSSQRKRKSCSTCEMFEYSNRDSGVIISCLDCFLRNGELYLYEYGVTKTTHHLSRRGTCNTAESGSAEVVMARAESELVSGFGDYHLFTNNCEDFATYCKTGQKCDRNGLARCYGQASLIPHRRRRRRAQR